MHLFWIIVLTCFFVVAGSSLCLFLLNRTRDIESSYWILDHIACPIIRIFVLLIIISLVYPRIDLQFSSADFWVILLQQGNLNSLINILFFAGLAISFVPLLSHPVLALPLQSYLTMVTLFSWQYGAQIESMGQLIPSLGWCLKILGYMILVYFLTRESSLYIARRVDRLFVITGSIRLIADAIYLVLQIPVMLMIVIYLQALIPL